MLNIENKERKRDRHLYVSIEIECFFKEHCTPSVKSCANKVKEYLQC